MVIQSKNDYLLFLKEDLKANLKRDKISLLGFLKGLILGIENYRVVRYLRILRKLEYINNCKTGYCWGGGKVYVSN